MTIGADGQPIQQAPQPGTEVQNPRFRRLNRIPYGCQSILQKLSYNCISLLSTFPIKHLLIICSIL